MIPSETSEDRDFVVSDTDELSYVSHNCSKPFDSYYFCQGGCDGTSVNEVSGSISFTVRLLTVGFMIAVRENPNQNRHSTISESRRASGRSVSCSVVLLGGEAILNVNSLRSHKAKFAHELCKCSLYTWLDRRMAVTVTSTSLSNPSSSQFKTNHGRHYVGSVDFVRK